MLRGPVLLRQQKHYSKDTENIFPYISLGLKNKEIYSPDLKQREYIPLVKKTKGIYSPGIKTKGIYSAGINTKGIYSPCINTKGIYSPGIKIKGIYSRKRSNFVPHIHNSICHLGFQLLITKLRTFLFHFLFKTFYPGKYVDEMNISRTYSCMNI